MTFRLIKLRTHSIAASAAALLVAAGASAADPSFEYTEFTGTTSPSINLNSDREWVTDQNDSGKYSPRLDQRIRIFASPWARSASLTFQSGALRSGDDGDRMELGWADSSPQVLETGDTMPLGTMSVSASGDRSLMDPGLAFRFKTGAAPETTSGNSEADGFKTDTLSITAGTSKGDESLQTLRPFERAIVVVNKNDAVVDFKLPTRLAGEGVTLAAWLESPGSSTAPDVGVWMRCNAYPNATNYDFRKKFAVDTPVFIKATAACSGSWYVTIGSTASSTKIVHVTASAHNLNRTVSGERIGIKFNATQEQRDGIVYGFRSAAWRIYGMSEGTLLLQSFRFYNNSSCSKLNGCGGAGCSVCVTKEECRSNVNTFDGYMTICNNQTSDLITNDPDVIDPTWGGAQVIAHEFAHQWMAQPDEYWDVNDCGGSIGLCGHSMMERFDNNVQGLCNDLTHRTHVEDRRTEPWNRIRGPIGYACNGGAGWVDQQPGWTRWSQGTPGGMVPTYSPQNLNYVRQGFTVRSDVGAASFP